ncbi:NAD(P)/FAD-dependent oxidoreductase [Sporolactobacillus shoreicorticis]|uniref:NAD(P)/FAD-dependent oxidoreductase n=1 Tax=Sporolactobacillus shoreicorticis TaxID=1923877 RepID=A0ABW5S9A0_9BACL|nr:NAD(P)/FAD-dependent oxidoreductase [Sporolactobacillus shoreicorticis]MCO7127326.1 NAD(P)/FAD-dependent oxidoreductase [Sporolactobacillus shoreicorticis]
MSKPKIVILGAGYGGMMATVRLTKELTAEDADITLVNKHNYHYQTTWLHEAAAGTIHHDRTRMLIKNVINTNRVNFMQDSVQSIDRKNHKVLLKNGEIDYDYLIIALGFESNTFGIKGLEENAFAIRSVNTARKIREHIEYRFASYNSDPDAKDSDLTIVVGGAGLSGVEFLGELIDRIPALCKEYDIDPSKVRIVDVEGMPFVLPPFDRELADYAQKYLESKGVEFRLSTFIKEATPEGVKVQKKDSEELEEIQAGTVVWTGGVKANHIPAESGFATNRGKIQVSADLRSPEDDHIFAIGDVAVVFPPGAERPYPPTAQIAIQEAENLAKNMKHILKGEETELFVYKPKGTVASLGEKQAIGVVFDHKLTGKPAAAMKKVIDDRYLLMLGGVPLVLKKGKLNLL